MRLVSLIQLCLGLLLAQSSLAVVVPRDSSPSSLSDADPFPALTGSPSHRGVWLTDDSGRTITFHGINMASKIAPYTMQSQGFSRDHAAMLAREGFSVVRVWVFWSALEPQRGVWNDSTLAAMEEVVGWLHAYNIGTILNFAQVIWGEYFGGLGFPSWAVNTNGLQTRNETLYEHGFTDLALWAAYDHFWNDDHLPGDSISLQTHFVQAWQLVAKRFAGNPGIVGYDLVNEPHGGSASPSCVTPLVGCPLFDTLKLSPFYRKVVAGVRTIDTQTPILFNHEVTQGAGLSPSFASAGNDPNVWYTNHYYPQLGNPGKGGAAGDLLMHRTHAASVGAGYLFTEFGANDDTTAINDVLNAADSLMTSWLYWAWWSDEPSGDIAPWQHEIAHPEEGIVYDPSQPPTASNLKAFKLEVLGRPYPFLVAGEPTSWTFDNSTKRFTLDWKTKGVPGQNLKSNVTSVVVPKRLYLNGYSVKLGGDSDGARVASVQNAFSLDVQHPPSASRMSLTITPN